MTVITYGKSVTENAKSLRHARRRAAAMDRERIESIIDPAFDIEAVKAAPDVEHHISRIDKAVSSPSLRDRNEGGAVCLPSVAIYSAGHRKSKDIVTAR